MSRPLASNPHRDIRAELHGRGVIRAVRDHDFPPATGERKHCALPRRGPLYGEALNLRRERLPMSKERSDRAPATTREPAQEGAPDRTPAAASSRAEIDTFLSRVNALGPVAESKWARPARFRARCDHEPATDMGSGLRAAGRHVPRSGLRRQPRHPACLFSRSGGMPRLALGPRTANGSAS